MPSALLTPFQKKVLKAFTGIEESKAFYLTGGTALSAFYLAHRRSEDFDLFTSEEPLIAIVARKFKSALESLGVKIVKSGKLSLEEMIELAKKKDPGLDEYYLAIAFEQSEKIPDEPTRLKVDLITPVDPKEIKDFFAAEAVKLLEKARL